MTLPIARLVTNIDVSPGTSGSPRPPVVVALAQLVTDGRVDMTDPAVLIIHAEQAPNRPTRSPTVHYGRTGEPAARELEIETICTQTQTADGLFDTFRLEADL